jgi:hypothetical protein
MSARSGPCFNEADGSPEESAALQLTPAKQDRALSLGFRWWNGQSRRQRNVRLLDAAMVRSVHRFPRVEQSHVAVVKDIAVLIPWILIVPRLKCKGSVNEIEIEIVEPECLHACLERRFDALGPVIGVPQLRGDKDVFAREPPSGTSLDFVFNKPTAMIEIWIAPGGIGTPTLCLEGRFGESPKSVESCGF